MALLGFYSILVRFRDLTLLSTLSNGPNAHSDPRLSWYNPWLEVADKFDLMQPVNR
jgi:hypothetical protein